MELLRIPGLPINRTIFLSLPQNDANDRVHSKSKYASRAKRSAY